MLDWEFYIDGYGYLQSRPILNKAQFRYQPFSLTQLSVVYLILKVLCIYCSRPLKLIKFLCKIFNFWTRPSIVIQLNKLYMSLVATQKNYYFVFFVKFIVWFETWSLWVVFGRPISYFISCYDFVFEFINFPAKRNIRKGLHIVSR